ncbi:MAG: pseudouridylate synthase family protein [Parachlamydiales bacterium]|nr:pseudouridylate synthase family protein [Parachlamydiales bacterium]
MKSSDNVVYCDNHILVANKPAGWLTQPDGTETIDLEEQMKEWVKTTYQKKGAVFLHAVHRIDRPVSGLVLFARTSKALSRLNDQVRANGIHRFYVARVEGVLPNQEGDLEHYLIHGDHRAIVSSSPDAKLAQLHYWVEKVEGNCTRVRIELKTGRYHQIRAQFAAICHPVVGDVRYQASSGDGKTIQLHSAALLFTHPVAKEEMRFDCPAPF